MKKIKVIFVFDDNSQAEKIMIVNSIKDITIPSGPLFEYPGKKVVRIILPENET